MQLVLTAGLKKNSGNLNFPIIFICHHKPGKDHQNLHQEQSELTNTQKESRTQAVWQAVD